MKKVLVIFLILALMSIGGVNAAELDGNKTMVDDVLSVGISYENSTDLLSVGATL